MRLPALAVALGMMGCHTGSPEPRAASDTEDGPCALVDAMLAIDDSAYQKIYAGAACGDESAARVPRIVEVNAPIALVPRATTCPGHTFRLFHGETDVVGMIIQLDVFPNGTAWSFMASVRQPNATELPDGGFESVQTLCHVVTGFVEKRGGRWHTFVDRERPFGPNAAEPAR